MDAKESQLFDNLYWRLSEKTFNEIDVYCFFILLRAYAKPNGWLQELGHSVAHRRRNRGILFDKFETLHKYIFTQEHNKESYLSVMEGIPALNLSRLKFEINTILEGFDKPIFDDSIIEQIMLYTLSLMQTSLYEKDDVRGRLFTFFTDEYAALMANLDNDSSPFYCFAKLDIHISTKDTTWWKDNWFSMFDMLRKTPFSIRRDNKKNPQIYLEGNVL